MHVISSLLVILGVCLVIATFVVSIMEWLQKRGSGLPFHEWFYSDRTEAMAMVGAGLFVLAIIVEQVGR